MSWPWSTAPPPAEEPLLSTTDPTPDPYAAPSDFGTAFGDDLLSTSTDAAPPTDSFDFYTPPPPTSFPLSDPLSPPPAPTPPSSSSTPTLDFNAMRRINPSQISPRASLNTSPAAPGIDYVFSDDYKPFRKKCATEQLTYLTGGAYLTGALIGASSGCVEALRASAGKSSRLRLNAVLNASGKRGAVMANALGVLALAFSLSETAVYNYTSDETMANYALAGGAAGAIYKSTRGVRVAGVWAMGGALVALGTVYASREGWYGRGLQGVL